MAYLFPRLPEDSGTLAATAPPPCVGDAVRSWGRGEAGVELAKETKTLETPDTPPLRPPPQEEESMPPSEPQLAGDCVAVPGEDGAEETAREASPTKRRVESVGEGFAAT